ncbi:hypothetical protein GCM10025876_04360 [Demequina litorisediminis]|uniref:leucine--tRNA ligase n=1 Tax=Demequina litorisediminis TaxID=1849022 RepID=A0ABQ6IAP5_9MICO|nr:hypothetical protein GCM10025876_04360 [Demequina litorisediminis]
MLADYGHGAIMAVPAHDQRDLDFARAMDLPVRVVLDVRGEDGEPVEDPAVTGVAAAGDGTLINSGSLDGKSKADAIEAIVAELGEAGTGAASTNYRLRDWLISRQRYWGTPIPIVHCDACGEVRVPDDQPAHRASARRGPRPQAQGHLAPGWCHGLGEHRLPLLRWAREA